MDWCALTVFGLLSLLFWVLSLVDYGPDARDADVNTWFRVAFWLSVTVAGVLIASGLGLLAPTL